MSIKRFGLAGPTLLLAFALVVAGCSSKPPGSEQASGNEAGKSEGVLGKLLASTKPVTVPAGTAISVTLDQALASDQNRNGDEFAASVSAPVVVDGKTVIPKGARAKGRVVEARESGRLQDPGRLRLALASVEVDGKDYDLETSTITRARGGHKKRNIAYIGGGAGAGAIIGGIAGGGKGALIGSAVGAGAGTAGAAMTGKKDVRLPAETPLSFKLAQPVTIDLKS